jgi:hypothetical protein
MTENNTNAIPSLDDILNQAPKTTGNDISPGSYPATLYGFSEPFRVKTSEKFRKPGQPDSRVVFDAKFAIFDKTGQIADQTYLLPVPDGGKVNRKSNMFKMLTALAGGNPELVDADGNIKGKLSAFIGSNAVLAVGKNEEGWPKVEGVGPKMAGGKYPTLEECKGLASEGTPF